MLLLGLRRVVLWKPLYMESGGPYALSYLTALSFRVDS